MSVTKKQESLTIEQVLTEEAGPRMVLNIPPSINKTIEAFQHAHKKCGFDSKKPTKQDVVWILMVYGHQYLLDKIEEYKNIAANGGVKKEEPKLII